MCNNARAPEQLIIVGTHASTSLLNVLDRAAKEKVWAWGERGKIRRAVCGYEAVYLRARWEAEAKTLRK